MFYEWPILGRCCFCLPLRKGVIIIAVMKIVSCIFFISLLSYTIHNDEDSRNARPYTQVMDFPAELSIAVYCAEVIFNIVLIYGVYSKTELCLKVFFYFAMVSMVATMVLQIISCFRTTLYFGYILDMMIFIVASLCLQLYMITLVRSLLKKLEIDGPHVYDNKLHQIVTGELNVDNGVNNKTVVTPAEVHGVYNNLTTPVENKY